MDLKPDLKQYLSQKKWTWRSDSDDNISLKQCPFCKSTNWKFSVHKKTTQYRCWRASCSKRGNLRKLKKAMGDLGGGDRQVVSAARLSGEGKEKTKRNPLGKSLVTKWHRQLMKDEKVREYLDGRGLGDETIAHFKLGVRYKGGKRWLAIPHMVEGVCENIKFRSLPPAEKTFRRRQGAASVLFNADALDNYDEIVLCEAETDAMSFWEAGVKNVVSLTCGADTFLADWYDLMEDKEKVIIVLDADEAGQSGARDIARRLGFDRCYNVLLPMHDANEVLQQMGPQELARTLDTAEQFEVAGVHTAADICRQHQDDADIEYEQGILTPWDDVNGMIGPGFQPGDLIILSAKPKIGKTTFALNVCLHNALQDIPALVFCLEMRPKRLVQKIVGHLRKKDYETLDRTDWVMARYLLQDVPLHFVEPEWRKEMTPEYVFDKIRESVKRHGVRLVVFDHLHFLVRSLQFVTNEIGQVTRGFKMLSEELEVSTILIAQPKKVQGGRVMDADDIKDSASIPADGDFIAIMHREAIPAGMVASKEGDQEVLESKTLFRMDRARFGGGGECYLQYEGALATFRAMQLQTKPTRS
jgi:5S rRNA maturation endonuclease (ribonuclease M5)